MSGETIDLNPLLRRRRQAACDHPSVLIDASLADLECEVCGKQINPYWFIERLAEGWNEGAKRLEEYDARIKEHEAKMIEQHERNISIMNARAAQLRADVQTLEAKRRQLMLEDVGGKPLGVQVKRWRRT